ncbi:hypothetical protein Golomagni_05361 [Golovinomyces magnicellulatus]|nr:hypothetical protein Golomagni_05361 [Golovinomyces magnicellulatus]
MKFIIFLLATLNLVHATELAQKTATISFQPIGTDNWEPRTLATITFDSLSLDTELTFYETPLASELFYTDHPPRSKYLRLGIYDVVNASWASSTTLTSKENFAKGYSPTITINFDTEGEIIGVSVKGHRIDAGETRDFGPKIKVVQMTKGPRPYLNRPVVLKEGKVEEIIPEKSFLQKYWWIILAALMVIMSAKGDPE